jgi:hypothetical protein
MLAEFKEKTYEKYFGFELARQTNVTFSPDQCDEAFLGFDDAFLVPGRFLTRRLPHMRRKRWARGFPLSELDHIADELGRHLPPFKFNLFVQYKRPEYLSRASASEWSCWQNSYFRYETTPHQHVLLAKLEKQSHGRAATVYAAPAFWRSEELYTHAQSETIITQSNIASVGRLNGHSRFSYLSAGCAGKGHSDPVDIESQRIAQIFEAGMSQEGRAFNQHIKSAALQIEEAVKGDELAISLLDRARTAIVGEEVARPTSESLSYAFATIEAFSDAFDVSYYAFG